MHVHTMQTWRTQLITLYRIMVPHLKKGEGTHDLDVISACKLPPPMMLLALQRFSLFDRIVELNSLSFWLSFNTKILRVDGCR